MANICKLPGKLHPIPKEETGGPVGRWACRCPAHTFWSIRQIRLASQKQKLGSHRHAHPGLAFCLTYRLRLFRCSSVRMLGSWPSTVTKSSPCWDKDRRPPWMGQPHSEMQLAPCLLPRSCGQLSHQCHYTATVWHKDGLEHWFDIFGKTASLLCNLSFMLHR